MADWAPASPFLLIPLLLIALSLIFAAGFRPRRTPPHSRRRTPPSPPWDLPLLGHIHLLPHFFATSFVLRQRRLLGPVFSLRFGAVTTVFLASEAIIRETLVPKRSSVFSSRLQTPGLAVLNNDFRNIFSSNGTFWREARRNLVQHVLSPKALPTFIPARERALGFLIGRLWRESAGHHGVVSALINFRIALLHLAITMCFGFSVEDEALLSQISATLEEASALYAPLTSCYFYPFLRPLLTPRLLGKAQTLLDLERRLLLPLIIEHQDRKKTKEKIVDGSYLESLLVHVQNKDPGSIASEQRQPHAVSSAGTSMAMADHDLIALCSEFLDGTVTTLSATLEWTMAHLVQDPAIQEKLYSHICQAVGDRPVQEEDLRKLPYLQAVVMETLRLHPPAPVLMSRETTERCELGGYDMPAGTIVNFCVGAIAMDAEVWEDPREFRPERMMGVEVDLTGTKKVSMLPFGAGRRICPGMGVGRTNMEMVLARAVREYQWLPSGGGVDMSEHLRLTVCMAKPLRPIIRRRGKPPNHLALH